MNKLDNFQYSESCKIQQKHQCCSIYKIGRAFAFSVDPPKTLYFPCNSFSSRLTENLHKEKHFTERCSSCFVYKIFL